MASTTDPEAVKGATPPPPQPEAPPCRGGCSWADVTLRVLLFAASLVALVVMVTSEETKTVMVPPGMAPPGAPTMMRREAKFNHSPAFIYFVAAFAVACLYSIITTIASVSIMLRPNFSSKFLLHFAIMDILMLGVVASATGTAGGVAYVGLNGNSHVGWGKVCNVYDKYCKHVASSLAMALFSSVLLVLLSILSACSLSKMIRD